MARFRLAYSYFLLATTVNPVMAEEAAPPKAFGWISREQLQQLPVERRPSLDPTCPGTWLTPILSNTPIGKAEDSELKVEAENVSYDQNGNARLKGSVSIRQPGRRIDADNVDLSQNNSQGHFSGNILIAEPGLVLTGEQADIDLRTQQTTLTNTEFVSAPLNAHGHAGEIERDPNGHLRIHHTEYSTCPPDARAWFFKAKEIYLNPETGRGEVAHGVLNVAHVPVMYFPYFNFPIDDRRQSGLLIPRFGTTNDGGFDLSLPIYLNLASNYDMTITPRLMTQRGNMMEGEFRYLLPYLGNGMISGGYLPSDKLYGDLDRSSLRWQQNSKPAPNWRLKTDVNYVSDSAYFIDLGTDLNLTNTSFQERLAELSYRQNNWTVINRVQSYQTIDPLITDVNKPYARLPQIQFSRLSPVARGLENNVNGELTYFQRHVDDGSGPEINGSRFLLSPSLRYAMVQPWGHLTPGIGLRMLTYSLEGNGVVGNSVRNLALPTVSLDTGLVLEREGSSLTQTLEPRLLYLYTPYREQSDLPNFDTANSTFSYLQLWRESRFSGGDRIDDANQVSLGLTSRLIAHDSGEEIVRASLGQILYLRDRKVGLDATTPIATDSSSGLVGEVAAPIGRGWSGTAEAQLTPDLQRARQYSIGLNYLPATRDRLLNIGYTFRGEDLSLNQQTLEQTSLSLILPIGVQWQAIGVWQYDLLSRETQQAVAGLEYESCCWKIRLYERQFLADPDDLSPGAQRQRRAFFIEAELKGLAGFSSGIKSLLGNAIFGYNQLMESRRDARGFMQESP